MATGQYNFDTTTKPIFFEVSSSGLNTVATNGTRDSDYTVTIPGNGITLGSNQVPILSLVEYSIPNTIQTFKTNVNDTLIFQIGTTNYRVTIGDIASRNAAFTVNDAYNEIHQMYNLQMLVQLLNNWCRGDPTTTPAGCDVSLLYSVAGNSIQLSHTPSGASMQVRFYGTANLPVAYAAYAGRLANQQFGLDNGVGVWYNFPTNAQSAAGQNWVMNFSFAPMLSYDDFYCIQVIEPKCANNRKSSTNAETSTLAMIPIHADLPTTSGILVNSSVLVSDTTSISQFKIRIVGERSNETFDFADNPVTLRFRLDSLYKAQISSLNPQNQLGVQNILRDSTGYAEASYMLPNYPGVPPQSKRGRLF